MKRLTKAQAETLNDLHDKLCAAVEAYNAALQEFEAFRAEIHEVAEGYYHEKSDRWQESDAGNAYTDFMQSWEESAGDELDTPPDYPGEVME